MPTPKVLYAGTADSKGWRVVRNGKGQDTHLAPDGTGYRPLRQTVNSVPDLVVKFNKAKHLLPPLNERVLWLRELGPRQLEKRLEAV